MISILCPTRGRPLSLADMISSAARTCDEPVEFVLRIDADDVENYPDWQGRNVEHGDAGASPVRFVCGERRPLMDAWNICAEHAQGEILMHAGDDLIFRTPGWDRLVRRAFEEQEDRILFVHGNDGSPVHGNGFGTHGFLHRRWVDTVGYFVPPYFASDWNDVWLNEVAEALGRRRYIPLLIEHMHPLWGKRSYDQTDYDRLARGAVQRPEQVYLDRAPERAKDVAKLRAVIGRPGSQGSCCGC